MRQATKLFNGLETVGAVLAGVMFFCMMLLVCLDVFMRYVVQNPFGWVVEVCEYMLLYVTFLGAPWLLRRDLHVRVEVIYRYLPDRSRDILLMTTNVLGMLACLILFLAGCQSTWEALLRGTPEIKTLNLPKWTLLWVIPYGSLMMALEFVRKIYGFVRPGGEPDQPAAKAVTE